MANVEGIIHAADTPCIIRPKISNAGKFVIIINAEPIILNNKPIFVIFTRPILSARPPVPTTNMPENSAVRLTAILIVPISAPKLRCKFGTTFTSDCANNQNVITPNTIPKINLLPPRYVSFMLVISFKVI
uniref:Uncharacterized protein n=1 Tax=Staphylococcus aureus TaxID=1280 RepID=Q936E7_STAAU|nr:unknown [Staphylococcus aureus]